VVQLLGKGSFMREGARFYLVSTPIFFKCCGHYEYLIPQLMEALHTKVVAAKKRTIVSHGVSYSRMDWTALNGSYKNPIRSFVSGCSLV